MQRVEVDPGDGRFTVYAREGLLTNPEAGWVAVMVKETEDIGNHWPILVRGDGLIIGPMELAMKTGLPPQLPLSSNPMLVTNSTFYRLPEGIKIRIANVSLLHLL